MRIYIKEGQYQKADDQFFTAQSILKSDPIAVCLDTILSFYGLTDYDLSDQASNQALQYLKAAENVPEANYILGIMYAEGYKVPRDVNAAKLYFEKGNQWAQANQGQVGYTDYEFSVLSDISQQEILKTAQSEAYHSKFFLERQKIQNTQKSASAKTSEKKSGLYYAVSPWAVKHFGKYGWFHRLFKAPLDTFVRKLQQSGIQSTPYND